MIQKVVATPIYASNARFSSSATQLVIVAPADDGPLEPTVLTQPEQALALYRGGRLVEWAAWAIDVKGFTVLAVRADAPSVSAFSAVARTVGHGTSVVTVDAASDTDINADVGVLVVVGGDIGTAGIIVRVTTNGGRTFGANVALGVATDLDITLGEELATLNFAAGTLAAGEYITFTASLAAAGSYGVLDETEYPGGTATANASVTAATYPNNDYEIVVEFPVGGALGTAGITYRTSTAAARNEGQWQNGGQAQALGTALAIVIPGTGGASITLGTAGQTITSGAVLRLRTYAPNFTAGSLAAALVKVFRNKTAWELVLLGGNLDASMILATEATFANHYANTLEGEKAWLGGVRPPNQGETDAEYFAAMQPISTAARSCYHGGVCYGDAKAVTLDGFLHKRPIAMIVGPELASTPPHIEISRTDRSGMPATLALDDGNPDCHDEEVMPGPDDYGFITLRKDPNGVYVTNARLFSPAGSKFAWFPHRWCMNILTRITRAYFRGTLSVGINAGTNGRIDPVDADRLETEANDLNDALRANGWISRQNVSVSRTDDLANTEPPTLTISGQFVSLLYPKRIDYTMQMVATIRNGNE